MKKFFFPICLILISMVVMMSCEKKDNPVENPSPSIPSTQKSILEKNFLSVDKATYHDGAMPSATVGNTISGISYNKRALQGGMNIISIVTDKTYKKFYVGVKGVNGYWIYIPETNTTRAVSDNIYTIPIMYSSTLNSGLTMLISGEDENGDVTEPYEAEISIIDTEIGELNINLTFSNAKDVDLHLFMPDGEHIFYGARGGSVQTADGTTVTYGLDHDSNADCRIDNLNNENIYIPAELIQTGTYRVVVDMFSNCDRSTSTSWLVSANYKGQAITPTSGTNPASGVYPVGAGDGDMTTIMEFTINNNSTRSANFKFLPNTFVPTPLTDMDEMKLEEASFRMNYK